MYLTVSKPRIPFGALACNIDRMFDDMFTCRPTAESEMGWAPRADVHENDNAFVVQLDLPGVEKDNVKVKFEEFKEQKKELAPQLAEKSGSHLVTRVGNVVVLYRPKPIEENPSP